MYVMDASSSSCSDLDELFRSYNYFPIVALRFDFERFIDFLSDAEYVENTIVFRKTFALVDFYVTDVRRCKRDIFRISLKIGLNGKLISFRAYKKAPSLGF